MTNKTPFAYDRQWFQQVEIRMLYVFFIIHHARRQILHVNVTAHPTAEWVVQQLREAFPFETAPRYMILDRDGKYGSVVPERLRSWEVNLVRTGWRSPCQNPYAERLIGTLRRDCIDHLIVVGENHLRRVLRDYLVYYHSCRTHLSLDKDSPEPRKVEAPDQGKIVELSMVGGPHHRYSRLAA